MFQSKWTIEEWENVFVPEVFTAEDGSEQFVDYIDTYKDEPEMYLWTELDSGQIVPGVHHVNRVRIFKTLQYHGNNPMIIEG